MAVQMIDHASARFSIGMLCLEIAATCEIRQGNPRHSCRDRPESSIERICSNQCMKHASIVYIGQALV